mmetsp:Transcript_24352/g.39403  ORF Transcript_24352/g.39403 Transcript_24352/m.39403 type:complete len:223 (+) Transcript_24352:178-846(+)
MRQNQRAGSASGSVSAGSRRHLAHLSQATQMSSGGCLLPLPPPPACAAISARFPPDIFRVSAFAFPPSGNTSSCQKKPPNSSGPGGRGRARPLTGSRQGGGSRGCVPGVLVSSSFGTSPKSSAAASAREGGGPASGSNTRERHIASPSLQGLSRRTKGLAGILGGGSFSAAAVAALVVWSKMGLNSAFRLRLFRSCFTVAFFALEGTNLAMNSAKHRVLTFA